MSTTNHRKREWGEYLRPPREPLSHLISPHTMNPHFPLHNFLFILGGFHDRYAVYLRIHMALISLTSCGMNGSNLSLSAMGVVAPEAGGYA